MKPECIDNFLGKKEFDELQTLMMGEDFAWYFNPYIVSSTKKEKGFQFIHMFYQNDLPRSAYFKSLLPIFEIINPITLWRTKANLLTRTPSINVQSFHIDREDSPEKLKYWTTSIFYINTNNGYSKFEDGTQVESVANRMVMFPANMKHCGTSCTDEKTRVVINFNYFK